MVPIRPQWISGLGFREHSESDEVGLTVKRVGLLRLVHPHFEIRSRTRLSAAHNGFDGTNESGGAGGI